METDYQYNLKLFDDRDRELDELETKLAKA
jgi:hypothetical protein